jgi:deazaflavin-dependent oxidoreductase (nitroreductase family)
MSQIARVPKTPVKRFTPPPMNPFMVWLLQSPLHRLVGGSHLLVKYRGRKTGIERCFPVGYARQDDGVVILVGRAEAKTWWRNFLTAWPVTVVIRGHTVQGTALVVKGDSEEGAALARAYFLRFPSRARAGGADLTFVRVSLSREVAT